MNHKQLYAWFCKQLMIFLSVIIVTPVLTVILAFFVIPALFVIPAFFVIPAQAGIRPYDHALLSNLDVIPAQAGILPSPQLKRQHGATLFMNYCSGCHTLKYMRFNRMVKDLKLDPNQVFDFSTNSLPEQDAKQWFGKMPPDLSLIARERGIHWLTSYFNGFYPDRHQPFGVNNKVLENVAMPDVLAPLKIQNPMQFAAELDDLLLFLDYVAEPVQLIRYTLGFAVVFLFLILAVFMLRAYFARIHDLLC